MQIHFCCKRDDPDFNLDLSQFISLLTTPLNEDSSLKDTKTLNFEIKYLGQHLKHGRETFLRMT